MANPISTTEIQAFLDSGDQPDPTDWQNWAQSNNAGADKFYSALLTQASTNAPTQKILASSLGTGVTITPARTGVGVYTLTASSAVFTANKTQVMRGAGEQLGFKTATVTSTTVITITVIDETGTLQDGGLTDCGIEIRVYS